jgi:hypothetical protein
VILKQELADRWAIVAAVVAAGAGLAMAVAEAQVRSIGFTDLVVVPSLLGLAAWWLRAAWLAAARARKLRTLTELRTPVEPSTVEWNWFERAWRATTRLEKLARRALPEPMAARVREQVSVAARELYALASQASELTRQAKQIDGPRLTDETGTLRTRRAEVSGDAAEAVDRSLAAVADTRAVLDRLNAARELTVDQLAAGIHTLESLQARVLELGVLVRQSPVPAAPAALDELTDELEGLRRGVREVAEISRQALGGGAG